MSDEKPKLPAIALSAPKKESRQVRAIGYDAATQQLAVKFSSGSAEYRYFGVTQEEFKALEEAESIGSHLHHHIKSTHDFTRIDPPHKEH